MPLVKPDYYTLQEALDLIKGILPDEDALKNLREFLHSQPSAAWILDEDGRRVEIPNLWLSVPRKFHLTFDVEQGTAKFNEPGGPGAWRRPDVEGQIRIERWPLDALRAPVSVRVLAQEPNPQPDEPRPTVPRPRGRRRHARDAATRALDDLYPKEIPDKLWKTLEAEVNDWLAENNESPVSVDTVRRAANRK